MPPSAIKAVKTIAYCQRVTEFQIKSKNRETLYDLAWTEILEYTYQEDSDNSD